MQRQCPVCGCKCVCVWGGGGSKFLCGEGISGETWGVIKFV